VSNETSDADRLVALSPEPRNLPAGWRPPAPAWSNTFAHQTTPIVIAYFGTQFAAGVNQRAVAPMQSFLDCVDAPLNFEHARYTDRIGRSNLITAAYWTNPASYERWKTKSGFEAWWNAPERLNDGQGRFREILTIAPNRLETIFSHGILIGVAKTGCPVVGPIREHNYWGSMRDRLPVSARDDLRSRYGERMPRLGAKETSGRRLRVEAPQNLAIIRSGQDWTNCAGEELDEYDHSVRPALTQGMNYLRDNPDLTRCCDLRFAQETDREGSPLTRTFGLGYFLALEHLEKWAAAHPTHLAVFSRFLTMVRNYGVNLKLRLWHEVSVLPADGQVFEYINCHPETGLLPYFPSVEC
jgi:aldoxime dehydratase